MRSKVCIQLTVQNLNTEMKQIEVNIQLTVQSLNTEMKQMEVNIQLTVQNLNTEMKPMKVNTQLIVQNLNTERKPMEVNIQLTTQNLNIMIQATIALNKESFETAQTSQCHIRFEEIKPKDIQQLNRFFVIECKIGWWT